MALKTILITGCAEGGIGSALATEFHLRGHRVFASGRSEALLTHLQGLGIETVVLDVTSQDSIEAALAHVSKATGGKLDILINNAGILIAMPLADTDVDAARQLFEVNVLGVFAVTRAFVPLLVASARAAKKSAGARDGAMVVNIGSINASLKPPFFGLYNASKAALEVLGDSIRPELAPLGVRVVTVKTGSVRTNLFDNSPPTVLPPNSLYAPLREYIEGRKMLNGPRYMEPEEYAKKVVDELLKPSVKRVIWQGPMTTISWILTWFGWEGMMDNIYIKENMLYKLRY